jgi:hypothetical protein
MRAWLPKHRIDVLVACGSQSGSEDCAANLSSVDGLVFEILDLGFTGLLRSPQLARFLGEIDSSI